MVPDEWQESVLDAWLSRNRLGKWASTRCGLSVPRQNGKNSVIEVRELFGLVFVGEQILHTAHQVKTAREAFRRICAYFENDRKYPELAGLVKAIRRTNGQEELELSNGASVRFVARSRASARGYTSDVLILDEAQELTFEQMEALLPTLSSGPLKNSQVIMTGTPPGPTAPGEVFSAWRKDALAKVGGRLSWHEWSVEDIGDVKEKERWYATNPALGGRIPLSAIESECSTLTEDGFARERLGWWSSASSNALIEPETWKRGTVGDKRAKDGSLIERFVTPTGKLAYGIKFSPDGSTVALSVAIKPKEGRPFVECVDYRTLGAGTAWIAEWLLSPGPEGHARHKNASLICIDGRSGAEALAERLLEAGVNKKAIKLMSKREYCASCQMILNALRENLLDHYDQQQLNAAALGCRKRPIGVDGAWGFGGIEDTDISPFEAVSLAHYGAQTSKRNPGRKQKVAF
jgi:hypothetical protein